MNDTRLPNRPSNLPLVLAIAAAVAGLAATGVLFNQSRGLQARLNDTSRKLQQTQGWLDDTAKELQQSKDELTRVQASLRTSATRLAEVSGQLQETKSELEEAESQVSQLIPQ